MESPLNKTTALARVDDQPAAPLSIFALQAGDGFEGALERANHLASASIVPAPFSGNPGNCLIALEISARSGANIFAVVQNLNIIHNRPSWSAAFISGLLTTSGRFESIEYHESDQQGGSCYCTAKQIKSGRTVTGPVVSMTMANAEGWTRNSKWKSMPQVMLSYRAMTFFARRYCSDLLMGMKEATEAEDIAGTEEPAKPKRKRGGKKAIEETARETAPTETASTGAGDPPTIIEAEPIVENEVELAADGLAPIEQTEAEPYPPASAYSCVEHRITEPNVCKICFPEPPTPTAPTAPATTTAPTAPMATPMPPTNSGGTLDGETLELLQSKIGADAPLVIPYLVEIGWIKPKQGLQHMSKGRAETILLKFGNMLASARATKAKADAAAAGQLPLS